MSFGIVNGTILFRVVDLLAKINLKTVSITSSDHSYGTFKILPS